jgi:hypothetical protein
VATPEETKDNDEKPNINEATSTTDTSEQLSTTDKQEEIAENVKTASESDNEKMCIDEQEESNVDGKEKLASPTQEPEEPLSGKASEKSDEEDFDDMLAVMDSAGHYEPEAEAEDDDVEADEDDGEFEEEVGLLAFCAP